MCRTSSESPGPPAMTRSCLMTLSAAGEEARLPEAAAEPPAPATRLPDAAKAGAPEETHTMAEKVRTKQRPRIRTASRNGMARDKRERMGTPPWGLAFLTIGQYSNLWS